MGLSYFVMCACQQTVCLIQVTMNASLLVCVGNTVYVGHLVVLSSSVEKCFSRRMKAA